MARIERVSHCTEFMERLEEAVHLPAITVEAPDLPQDVLALLDHHLLDLGGTYGDPEAGEPIQYDELRVEHDKGVWPTALTRHRSVRTPCQWRAGETPASTQRRLPLGSLRLPRTSA